MTVQEFDKYPKTDGFYLPFQVRYYDAARTPLRFFWLAIADMTELVMYVSGRHFLPAPGMARGALTRAIPIPAWS